MQEADSLAQLDAGLETEATGKLWTREARAAWIMKYRAARTLEARIAVYKELLEFNFSAGYKRRIQAMVDRMQSYLDRMNRYRNRNRNRQQQERQKREQEEKRKREE
jgi:hypothetical protein